MDSLTSLPIGVIWTSLTYEGWCKIPRAEWAVLFVHSSIPKPIFVFHEGTADIHFPRKSGESIPIQQTLRVSIPGVGPTIFKSREGTAKSPLTKEKCESRLKVIFGAIKREIINQRFDTFLDLDAVFNAIPEPTLE